ncbi:metalloregulator ArsR/SmtB family transcription factor [Dyella sp. GSA-30]|uniref:ArsR/SmtB family transcription factor n=1 Tax=Dyella sp. GSA-30 TaxID=2994496 RepID=UPI00248FB7B0|nr:metalloregulator ArsR/SmtB family transcription factor [Dyella sp. GSA-30]BDU19612.1 transcriptional regulator [Dyella sp. GSA-30]
MSSRRARRYDAAPIFAALGDRTRLALVTKLSDGQSRSIAQLCADAEITRQAVTKHLHVLEDAGLVRSTRAGRESQFELRPESIVQMREYLDEVSRQWDDALARLRAFVER